jgi:transposase
MLSLANRRIFIAREPIDMRRGIDTLSGVISGTFQRDPYQGDVFVFLGRDRRRVKILVWDRSGFWLSMKRLESGRFAQPPAPAVDVTGHPIQPLSAAELEMVLEGIVVHHATYHTHYNRASIQHVEQGALTSGN